MRNRWTRATTLAWALVLGACEPDGAGLLQVRGETISQFGAWVVVARDGRPVTDAVVVVNGRTLFGTTDGSGLYSDVFESPLEPGTVTVEVTSGMQHVTGAGTMPIAPLVTTLPPFGFDPRQDFVLEWASPTDPPAFQVVALWCADGSCSGFAQWDLDGTARSFTIPAGSLPASSTWAMARVSACADGVFSGNYAPYPPDPGMNILAMSHVVGLLP